MVWDHMIDAEYHRNYYARTAERRREQKRTNVAVIRDRNRKCIRDFLEEHNCVDCGEADLVVLEFHHVNPDEKVDDVANLSRDAASLDRLVAEMLKCVVLCANCHRRRTAAEQGWHTFIG